MIPSNENGAMTIRRAIEVSFSRRAFLRPLFYAYPHGLRFSLSEGATALGQFLSAHRKASEICADIFDSGSCMTVCLRCFEVGESRFSFRPMLRSLSDVGIEIPLMREMWRTDVGDDADVASVFLAFDVSVDRLPSLLWCALASDFGSISPNPGCDVYLFNLDKGLIAFPYDDRGMDVVGTNRELLGTLYRRHRDLLEYDLPAMRATFGDAR